MLNPHLMPSTLIRHYIFASFHWQGINCTALFMVPQYRITDFLCSMQNKKFSIMDKTIFCEEYFLRFAKQIFCHMRAQISTTHFLLEKKEHLLPSVKNGQEMLNMLWPLNALKNNLSKSYTIKSNTLKWLSKDPKLFSLF